MFVRKRGMNGDCVDELIFMKFVIDQMMNSVRYSIF